ncbi:unnamed protein product [Orchesella dallaii]|uniref:Uncharacterized protein n=1 Tax=Orchesella dallaii TaxID=48710 RepID=A0ABP1Q221_9HEXA
MSTKVLAYIIICTIPYFISASPSPTGNSIFPENVIRIENKLSLFKECAIHVALNHINLLPPTSEDGSYTLEPFQEHPIILSLHRYKKVAKKGTSRDSMICNNDGMELLPNQHFQFKASPSPKANCYVQLYIDPAPCKIWMYYSGTYFHSKTEPFDRMYLDPGFDYQTENKNEIKRTDYNLAKSGIFFIHIMKHRYFFEYSQEVLFKVDYAWQQAKPTSVYNFIQPTKLLLQIEQQDIQGPFTPAYGGLLACHNYDEWWKHMEKYCTMFSSGSKSYRTKCLSEMVELSAEFPGILEYSGSTKKSWRELEDIVAKSESCQGHNIWIGSPSRKPARKMNNIYIENMKRNEEHGEDTDAIENVILTLLFPNATIFGSEEDDLLHTAQFLPFLTVTKKINMFTESTGYVGKLSQVQFITCAPFAFGSQISIMDFVAKMDFQVNLWLAITVLGMVSGLSIYLVLKVTEFINAPKKKRRTSDYLSFVWDFLLVQKTEAINEVRWIGAAWLLMGVIIANAYVGNNINELITPVPIKRVETFDELFTNNFSIHSTVPSASYMRIIGAYFQGSGPAMQSYFKSVSGVFGGMLGEEPETVFTQLFIKAHPKLTKENARAAALQVEKYKRKAYKSAQDMASTRDMDYFSNILAKCDRDAFVEARDTLDNVKLRLKRRLRYQPNFLWQLTLSKDSYGELIENWKFANIPWPATNFLIRTHGLLESGLVPKWKEWIHWVSSLSDKMGTNRDKTVSLNGYIRALFYVYLALSSIPILLFAREISISVFILRIKCTIKRRH